MSIISTSLSYAPIRFGKSAPKNIQEENNQLNQPPALSTEPADSVELKKNKSASTQKPYQPFLSVDPTIHHAKSVHVPTIEPEDTNPKMAMLLLQKLFLQSLAQQPKDGHIKLHLGSEQNMNMHGYAWLGDMLPLIGKPIDVIMESSFEKIGLTALLKAHQTGGQAYMMPDSVLTLLAPNNLINQILNHSDAQMEKRLSEHSLKALATLISEKSGETDSEKILQDLRTIHGNNKTWNPLQALHYGKTGLIDGIPIKGNHVITRSDLDQYLQKHNITSQEQIDDFLENHLNVFKIPNQPWKQVFPGSLPDKAKSLYQPIDNTLLQKEEKSTAPEPKIHAQSKATLEVEELDEQDSSTPKKEKGSKGKPISQQMHLYPNDQPATYAISTHGKNNTGSILNNDTIFYGEGVNSKDIGKLRESLLALDSKKAQEKDPKHIQLILSSPGGDVDSMPLFKTLLQTLKSPVDILITNMGCSAAAYMLIAASGIRLALPQSTLMIHKGGTNSLGTGNEMIESIARDISARSKRPFKDVMEDLKQDYYLNSMEALCYGPKGFIDGIVIGSNRIITRAHAMAYLSEQLGSPEKAEQYVLEKLQQLRDPKHKSSKKAGNNDPFANPLKTIHEIAKRGTVTLGAEPSLVNSGADTQSAYFEHHSFKQKPTFNIKLNLGGGLGGS